MSGHHTNPDVFPDIDAHLPQNLLPRGPFVTNVIMAYGGGNWVDYINNVAAASTQPPTRSSAPITPSKLTAPFSDQLSITNASIFDYKDGASSQYLVMVADQKAGRKIKMPTRILHSYYNPAQESGFDVQKVWSEYVDPSPDLATDAGFFREGNTIIELALQQKMDQLNRFMDCLGSKKFA